MMIQNIKQLGLGLCTLSIMACGEQPSSDGQDQQGGNLEDYRPAYHFSPQDGWMNDPNGLVYLDGEYHLFFQHNPDSTVWGPMHWGHAVSKDLFHWEEKEIALYPDSLGTIFSGSAVVDKDNTAGFGENALVAIYTNHSHEIEDTGTGLHETQSIAYSLDQGKTWAKYEGNPVMPNPGIWDFRDPKVFWHEEAGHWVMVLATKQSITFYTSPNLKEWTRTDEFGEGVGAHGGVWECPDLLRFATNEGEKWVLLVSINPGGPNTGSATQYFVGEFDGKLFRSSQQDIRWMDYGPDNYAGVTFSNVDDRHILIGWMSNWEYANEVPTSTWRSGNTVARELSLIKVADRWMLGSQPVRELETITTEKDIDVAALQNDGVEVGSLFRLSFEIDHTDDFEFVWRNASGDKLFFGYNKLQNAYYLNRSEAGHTSFSEGYVQCAKAPRASTAEKMDFTVLTDRNSVEIFADQGTTNLSGLFFVDEDLTHLQLHSDISEFSSVKFDQVAQTRHP